MFGSIATTTTLHSSREAKALQLLVGGATRRRRGSELRVRRFGKNRHTSSDRPNPINNHITELLVGIMLRWFFQVLITYEVNCKLPEGPYGWPNFLKISKNNKKRLVFFCPSLLLFPIRFLEDMLASNGGGNAAAAAAITWKEQTITFF